MASEVLSELDFGRLAEHYASRPYYGHFKEEVYPLFIRFLAALPSPARVLDLGAGPGHLAFEFHRAHPDRDLRFALLDSSREMLKLAEPRLAGRRAEYFVRCLNRDGWDEGLGTFSAVVSNNALFHVRPAGLDAFYAACAGRLNAGGLFLNQQSFGYADGESPYGEARFPGKLKVFLRDIFPDHPALPPEEEKRLEEEKRAALEKHRRALAEARAAGLRLAGDAPGYQFLSVERHLLSLRKAGLAAGCIWRKREFAVLCGVKDDGASH